mmetsp:Transcript_58725/g.182415  ORF Transcript_58725/g.182415 Transcript_58725/m.182415 type:complete len:272 (+) Transcript_58725:1054-1869(+)
MRADRRAGDPVADNDGRGHRRPDVPRQLPLHRAPGLARLQEEAGGADLGGPDVALRQGALALRARARCGRPPAPLPGAGAGPGHVRGHLRQLAQLGHGGVHHHRHLRLRPVHRHVRPRAARDREVCHPGGHQEAGHLTDGGKLHFPCDGAALPGVVRLVCRDQLVLAVDHHGGHVRSDGAGDLPRGGQQGGGVPGGVPQGRLERAARAEVPPKDLWRLLPRHVDRLPLAGAHDLPGAVPPLEADSDARGPRPPDLAAQLLLPPEDVGEMQF